MSAFSLFSPYRSLPGDASEWLYEPPMLASSVGWQQPNFPDDVLLVQQIVNIVIDNGYLEDQAATRLMETGSWDPAVDHAIGAIEGKFLSGMASPFGQRIVANGSPLFVFLVHLAAGNADLARHYSPLMYQLAKVMLPAGVKSGSLALYLPYILQALAHNGLADTEMVLMALATIRAETLTVRPISEGPSLWNSSPRALRHQKGTHLFDLYDNRDSLGNVGAPDGAVYRGRGFVQLTGRSNYTRFGKDLGWPLVKRPELANDSWVAAVLLARFLKAHETQIRDALRRGDLDGARRAVNGGRHGLEAFSKAMNDGRSFLRCRIANDALARVTSNATDR
ncbi:MAG TPA: hypothetical protein VKX25_13245 [Bryobacteraceae bacterium]|nr:hypothetical protein [Bryobacteraceae bacterium]